MTRMTVHDWREVECAYRPMKACGLAFRATFYRAVCECGFCTAYTSNPGELGRIMAQHALPGQMSLTM